MLLEILFALVLAVTAGHHSIRITGVFDCKSNPKSSVHLTLMERDPIFDDHLNWTLTRVGENFEIEGAENELTNFQPYLRVLHNCNKENSALSINFGFREGHSVVDIRHINLEEDFVTKTIKKGVTIEKIHY